MSSLGDRLNAARRVQPDDVPVSDETSEMPAAPPEPDVSPTTTAPASTTTR